MLTNLSQLSTEAIVIVLASSLLAAAVSGKPSVLLYVASSLALLSTLALVLRSSGKL